MPRFSGMAGDPIILLFITVLFITLIWALNEEQKRKDKATRQCADVDRFASLEAKIAKLEGEKALDEGTLQ